MDYQKITELLREKLFEARSHFLCERCGGMGIQPKGVWNSESKKYDAPAGICQLCEGTGYLGKK